MYTLTVRLKQHTPLLHFQPEQYGATLRASEVKPKLDRFLLYKLGLEERIKGSVDDIIKGGKDKAKDNNWLVGKGEHPSFNYKMRIVPNSMPIIEPIQQRFPCFFANMGDGTEQKQFSYADNGLTMTLSFPTPKEGRDRAVPPNLFEWISRDHKIAEFFFRYNFGTRGSKGFGSFYIDESDNLYVSPVNICKGPKAYRFFVKSTDERTLFEEIELFYKFMREGINYTNSRIPWSKRFYCKPLIWHYCKDVLGRGWEKKAIKTDLLQVDYSGDGAPDGQYYDVRDLFGLSSSENWRSYRTTISKEVKDIERMASPIFFKPIMDDGKGFFVYMNVNTGIKAVGLNKLKDAGGINISAQYGSITLDMPKDFSMVKFLKYFFEGDDYHFFKKSPKDDKGLVDDRYSNSSTCRTIKRIYDEIRQQQ